MTINIFADRLFFIKDIQEYFSQNTNIKPTITEKQLRSYAKQYDSQKIDPVKKFGANFQNTNLTILYDYDIPLRSTRFAYVDLSFAKLDKLDLTNSLFYSSNLSNASCRECLMNRTNLEKIEAKNIDFSYSSLIAANFSGANLTGANFSGANLTWVNFSGANLTGANFKNTILISTNFTNANLDNAFFIDTNIYGATFKNSSVKNMNIYHSKLIDSLFENTDFSQINIKTTDSRGSNILK